MSFTVIVCYTLTSSWLAKSRPERDEFQALHVLPVLGKYADAVDARFYDAEAFESEFSDFIVLTVEDLGLHASLLEDLQGSAMYTEGYLELNDFILGVEEIPVDTATSTQPSSIPANEGETS